MPHPRDILRLARPGDWTKNSFVLLAFVFWAANAVRTQTAEEVWAKGGAVVLAFVAFLGIGLVVVHLPFGLVLAVFLALAGRKANPGSGNSGGSPGTAETEESQSASGDHHNGGVGAAVPHAPQRHAHEPGWAQGEAVAPT